MELSLVLGMAWRMVRLDRGGPLHQKDPPQNVTMDQRGCAIKLLRARKLANLMLRLHHMVFRSEGGTVRYPTFKCT
jgi:hypothetical protein